MKPTIDLIVVIETRNTETDAKAEVTTVFQAKLPTNAVPRKGEKLSIYIWEDDRESWSHPSYVEVEEVYHNPIKGKWEQTITVRETLINPDMAPTDGTLKDLQDAAIHWMTTEIIPRLQTQGFKLLVAPNTKGKIYPE